MCNRPHQHPVTPCDKILAIKFVVYSLLADAHDHAVTSAIAFGQLIVPSKHPKRAPGASGRADSQCAGGCSNARSATEALFLPAAPTPSPAMSASPTPGATPRKPRSVPPLGRECDRIHRSPGRRPANGHRRTGRSPSGGQRQRLAIARALLADPRLFSPGRGHEQSRYRERGINSAKLGPVDARPHLFCDCALP